MAPFELLVARGCSPSAQRNAAVREARGEYIVFLDNDSEPTPGLLDLYRSILDGDPMIAAVGGPAVPSAVGIFQRVTALLLGDKLVMGRSAARYRSIGVPRQTDERELILCNLAVRKSAFLDAGGFDTALYPNEENEFLERLEHRGGKLLYAPQAFVTRPQWPDLGTLVAKTFTYGRGRATQARCRVSATTALRIGLALVVATSFVASVAAAFCGHAAPLVCAAASYGAYLVALTARFLWRGGLSCALVCPALATLLQVCYGLGLVVSLFYPRKARVSGTIRVVSVAMTTGGRA